ncbi:MULTISPECIES: hypothetical protein [Cupriavidus]|uniref:Uncharacterized protein n=1 Tax=Cupriavidus oxalaticus TaxID=96344 RepID=A0A4P7LFU3_9BURK|nr:MULTISPECIES: hypothetical protein [Cupriavidus]QBY55054.1 hypothetical protein E0W60_28275 [Cupriavidus oxalaticus]
MAVDALARATEAEADGAYTALNAILVEGNHLPPPTIAVIRAIRPVKETMGACDPSKTLDIWRTTLAPFVTLLVGC